MPVEKQTTPNIKGIWKPKKEGEKLSGFFKGSITFENDKFDSESFMIGQFNGSVVIVNDYKQLRDQFRNVDENDFVNIVYTGEKESKAGNNYKVFDVRAWILGDDEITEWDKKYVSFPELETKPKDSVHSDSAEPKKQPELSDADNEELPF